MDRLEMIKKAAEARKMAKTIKTIDERKAQIKRLTKSVKKAAHQAPRSLDCFAEDNMYYSDQDTRDFLAGSSYMDSYNSMKNDWDY